MWYFYIRQGSRVGGDPLTSVPSPFSQRKPGSGFTLYAIVGIHIYTPSSLKWVHVCVLDFFVVKEEKNLCSGKRTTKQEVFEG